MTYLSSLLIGVFLALTTSGAYASDPLIRQQWYRDHLEISRALTTFSPKETITVAVLDSGSDFSHEDLQGIFWTNDKELAGTPGVDDDQNGFVDDIHGFNFFRKNGSPVDDHGHGTQVAGIIAARSNNGIGIAGLAPSSVRIMTVKIVGPAGVFHLESAVNGIKYAVDNGAKIINASWNTPSNHPELREALEYAHKKGVLFVNSAGNEGMLVENDPQYPTLFNLPNMINVASLRSNRFLDFISNYSQESVHLSAPGEGIMTTHLRNSYKVVSGTSFAAPMVSAIAAMYLAQRPQALIHEVKQAILSSTKPVEQLQGRLITGGELNAFTALGSFDRESDEENYLNWNSMNADFDHPHPYPRNYQASWVISPAGASEMIITFKRVELTFGDELVILDEHGTVLETYSGRYSTSFQSRKLPGKVRMILTTDGSYEAFGFLIKKIYWR